MSTVVEVNEAKILATGGGATWWLKYRNHYEPVGRIKVVTASLGGDRVLVACHDREHADWLVNHAVGNGVPKSALKVKAAQ